MNNRQKKILEILTGNQNTSVQMLSEKLYVSGVTIRHDLNFLENEGLLKRIHGGAVLKDADDIDIRMGVNFDIKLKIARKASEQVQPGETVLIESGSINALLARELVQKDHITIITPNAYIARQFRNNRNANILLLGGLYQPISESLVGKLAKIGIDHLHFTKAFIGIDGFTIESGFTSKDLLRSEISSYIINKCDNVFIVSDSSKFGKIELTTICFPKDISYVVSEPDLKEPYRKFLAEEKVEVIYC